MFCGSVLYESGALPRHRVVPDSVELHRLEAVRRREEHRVVAEQEVQLPDVLEATAAGDHVLVERSLPGVLHDVAEDRGEPLEVRLAEVPAEMVDVVERAEQQPVFARIPGPEDLGRLDPFDRQTRVSLQGTESRIERCLDRLWKRAEVHETGSRDRARRPPARHGERVRKRARVTGHRPRLDLQKETSVGDRLRERSERGQVDPLGDRFTPDHAVGRLQTDQPTAPRRDTDRSAPVGRGGDRRHAGRHRRGRAPRRAAGRGLEVPRVPRRPVQEVVGEPSERELGLVRLAHHDRAGGLEASRDQSVGGGRPARPRTPESRRWWGRPATPSMSLTSSGIPASGPGSSPAAIAAVERTSLVRRPARGRRSPR